MKTRNLIYKITEALKELNLPMDKGIVLGDDTFLNGLLDGSEKVYGFCVSPFDEEALVIGNGDVYSVDQLSKADLEYIYTFILPKLGSYLILDIDKI